MNWVTISQTVNGFSANAYQICRQTDFNVQRCEDFKCDGDRLLPFCRLSSIFSFEGLETTVKWLRKGKCAWNPGACIHRKKFGGNRRPLRSRPASCSCLFPSLIWNSRILVFSHTMDPLHWGNEPAKRVKWAHWTKPLFCRTSINQAFPAKT